MKCIHFISSSIVALSVMGLCSVINVEAANDTKGSKPDQQQIGDKETTKSKLEGQKKGEGDAAFKDLNKHAPGGPEAAPDVKGHNKSGGAGTGTGSGTAPQEPLMDQVLEEEAAAEEDRGWRIRR